MGDVESRPDGTNYDIPAKYYERETLEARTRDSQSASSAESMSDRELLVTEQVAAYEDWNAAARWGQDPSIGAADYLRAGEARQQAEMRYDSAKDALEGLGESDQAEVQVFPSEVSDKATRLLDQAHEREKAITPALEEAAAEHGGELRGHQRDDHLGLEDHRFKGQGSLERKIDDKMAKQEISAEEAGEQVDDVLRYTVVLPHDQLADGVRGIQSSLEEKGYEFKEVKNTWLEDEPGVYRGINTAVVDPNGQSFELQFHTPASFAVKQEATHVPYEVARDQNLPPYDRDAGELAGRLSSWSLLEGKTEVDGEVVTSGLDRPPGIESIKNEKAGQMLDEGLADQYEAETAVSRVEAQAQAAAHSEVIKAQGDIADTTKHIDEIEDSARAMGQNLPADSTELDKLKQRRADAYQTLDANLPVESDPSGVSVAERAAADAARAKVEEATGDIDDDLKRH